MYPQHPIALPTSRHSDFTAVSELPRVRRLAGRRVVATAVTLLSFGTIGPNMLDVFLQDLYTSEILGLHLSAFLPAPLDPPRYGYPRNYDECMEKPKEVVPELRYGVRDGNAVFFVGYDTPTGFPTAGEELALTISIRRGLAAETEELELTASGTTTVAHLIRHTFEQLSSGCPEGLPTDTQGQPWNLVIENPSKGGEEAIAKAEQALKDALEEQFLRSMEGGRARREAELEVAEAEAALEAARASGDAEEPLQLSVYDAMRVKMTLSEAAGGIRSGAKLVIEEDMTVDMPQICIGRPYVTSSGKPMVAELSGASTSEWCALSVEQVLHAHP